MVNGGNLTIYKRCTLCGLPVAQVNKHGVTVKTFTEEQVEPVSACDGELIATDAVQAVTDCRDEHTECREAPARLSLTLVYSTLAYSVFWGFFTSSLKQESWESSHLHQNIILSS